MEELVTKAKHSITARGVKMSLDLEKYLRQEVQEAQSEHFTKMMPLLDIIKHIVDEMKITIGPGRGPAASSLLLFSKGFNHNHTQHFDLLPDLFFQALKPLIWVDVEYDSAPDFLNRLLKKTTLKNLREAKIFIFQCPFLTVLSQVEKKVGAIN